MHQETIEASPTKRLFINILTQDITLKAGILDLIDNCVDSYTRNKYSERREIKLSIDNDFFEIYDNCGGIELGTLKEKVFRFGSKVDTLDNPTLGMYGIGLKRSVFKLGDQIKLETDDGKNHSIMDLDVVAWQNQDKEWDIPFNTEISNLNEQKPYTRISITKLHVGEKAQLESDVFINDLTDTIRRTYCLIMKDNIDISLNSKLLKPYELYVQEDENYKPSVIIDEYRGIKIKIICFLDPSQGTRLKDAINQTGWNVFCNQRLILANDTSDLSGWTGGSKEDKSTLPKYHSLFNEFRGMVFLEANNPFDLPLNTSKTKLNPETESYHYILKLMIRAARPIIDYIYERKSKQNDELAIVEEEIANDKDESFIPTNKSITNFNSATSFQAPKSTRNMSGSKAQISYSRGKDEIEKVKKQLNVKTNKEVGEQTFDYFVSMEL